MTIEEPPPDSLIILVSSHPESLLSTIRSRCQALRFAPLAVDTVQDVLQRRRGLSDTDARFLAMVSGGRLGLALEADVEALRVERASFLGALSRNSAQSVWASIAAAEAAVKFEQSE